MKFGALLATMLWLSGCASTSSSSSAPAAQPVAAPNEAAAQSQPQAPRFTAGDGPALKLDGKRAMKYLRDLVAFGRRAPGSPGQKKQQAYLRAALKNDQFEEDTFSDNTPAGKMQFTNFIAKFPGTTDQIIVLASHYDTAYPFKELVGANDGGSSTATLLAIADALRGKKLTGPSVWLVFFDGEEAIEEWTATDSLYGSRHLAAKWGQDGTLRKVRAFLLLDMIGDRDLNIDRESNSTAWLSDMIGESAKSLNHSAHFFARTISTLDDHTPFLKAGVAAVDLIDFDYGYGNAFWHTKDDTIDKVSAESMQIVGDVVLETVRRLGVAAK